MAYLVYHIVNELLALMEYQRCRSSVFEILQYVQVNEFMLLLALSVHIDPSEMQV